MTPVERVAAILARGLMARIWDYADWEAYELWEIAVDAGLVVKHPEPYDPDKHGDVDMVEPGEEWWVPSPLATQLTKMAATISESA